MKVFSAVGSGVELTAAVLGLTIAAVALSAMPGRATQYVQLYSFGHQPDGIYPDGELLIDNKGVLYGNTSFGGSANQGAVFALTPPPAPIKVGANQCCGASPRSTLLRSARS